jgi:hypothetical protein
MAFVRVILNGEIMMQFKLPGILFSGLSVVLLLFTSGVLRTPFILTNASIRAIIWAAAWVYEQVVKSGVFGTF